MEKISRECFALAKVYLIDETIMNKVDELVEKCNKLEIQIQVLKCSGSVNIKE